MIVVTLVCVVLGIRVEYLRERAAFHERETAVIEDRNYQPEFNWVELGGQDLRMHEYHEQLAKEYRAAVCRPWNVVKEQTPVGESTLERLARTLVP